jgi:hypothetical protein
MDIKVKANQQGASVTVSEHDGGFWISVHRPRAFASTHFTHTQIEQLRDALIALTRTTNAAQ